MKPRGLMNVHITRNNCRDALPQEMTLKLPWYSYMLIDKSLAHQFQVQSPYNQATQCNW